MKHLKKLIALAAIAAAPLAHADHVGTATLVTPEKTVHVVDSASYPGFVDLRVFAKPQLATNTCVMKVRLDGIKIDQLILLGDGVSPDTARSEIKQRHWGWMFGDNWQNSPLRVNAAPGLHTLTFEPEYNATNSPLGNGHLHGNTIAHCNGTFAVKFFVAHDNAVDFPAAAE